MNENDLLNRWTLAVENPKLVDSLNLQIQRDRLKKGYKPGSSPAEVELRARQADLEQRRRDYIEKANAQRAEDVKSNGVGRALPQEVDFSTHQPYVNIEGVDKWGHGGLKFDPGTPDDGTISAPTRTSKKGTAGKPVVDPAKNFAAFQDAVHSRMVDESQAIARGTTAARIKREQVKEQAARMFHPGQSKAFTPIDAFGLGQDTLGESMTRNGQMIDVPRGGHFKDEDVFGPKVRAFPSTSQIGAPEATGFDPSENPVGDGDLPNDRVQGSPVIQTVFRNRGAGGSWDVAPSFEPQTAVSPDQYKAAQIADSQINEPGPVDPNADDFFAPERHVGRMIGNKVQRVWNDVKSRLTTTSADGPMENGGFYGNDPKFANGLPGFTDRRKPQTLIAPQTQPVAHRAY